MSKVMKSNNTDTMLVKYTLKNTYPSEMSPIDGKILPTIETKLELLNEIQVKSQEQLAICEDMRIVGDYPSEEELNKLVDSLQDVFERAMELATEIDMMIMKDFRMSGMKADKYGMPTNIGFKYRVENQLIKNLEMQIRADEETYINILGDVKDTEFELPVN